MQTPAIQEQPQRPPSVVVNGAALVPDAMGALWWPAEATLIVSDLHLEKGTHYGARGTYLPPYDSRTTLARLAGLVARLQPARVVALGDTFHDPSGFARMDKADRALLLSLAAAADWIWIEGNHDPDMPPELPGTATPEAVIGALTFRHEPQPWPQPGEIAGHLHPAARVRVRGRSLRRRCFASDGMRLVMPAFGAYAGGLCVRDAAFAPLFPAAFTAWMMGDAGVFPVGSDRLTPDA